MQIRYKPIHVWKKNKNVTLSESFRDANFFIFFKKLGKESLAFLGKQSFYMISVNAMVQNSN